MRGQIIKNNLSIFMRRNKFFKIAAVALIAFQCIPMLTGCNVIKSKKAVVDESLVSTCDSNKLYSGQYYVWHDEAQNNITRDINTDLSKFKDYTYDIFQPVYKESDPTKNTHEEDNDRVLWISDENDNKIPTLYKGDELIYFSTESIPTKIKLERFYDHGYSLGFYGLTENIKGSGQYKLSTQDGAHIKTSSSASKMAKYFTSEDTVVSIPSVGDKKIESKDVSRAGTIKGLIHGAQYDVAAYVGTNRHLIQMTADTHIFSSYELYTLTANSYDFVGDGIITINLPENLKTGYYYINGAGLFRYIDGNSYNDSTNFNDPGVIKDDNGKVIYDPRTTETKKTVYTNDDKINDSGISSSSKTSVNVKGQTVKIEAVIDKIINKSIAQTPTISYYLVDTSKSSTDDSESKVEGSKGNPYVIKATAEEIAQGKISREIPNLSNGVWMFTLSDVSNYETHTLNVTLKQK